MLLGEPDQRKRGIERRQARQFLARRRPLPDAILQHQRTRDCQHDQGNEPDQQELVRQTKVGDESVHAAWILNWPSDKLVDPQCHTIVSFNLPKSAENMHLFSPKRACHR